MLTIKTTKLQEMVARAMKGVGNNQLNPLTTMISILCSDGKLVLTTTDFTNYLFVSTELDGTDDFYAVINADQFGKLIARTTTEDINLSIEDKGLRVKGNGSYVIPMEYDNGEVVQYPNPLNTVVDMTKVGDISLGTVKTVLSAVKPALGVKNVEPCYVNYFFGDKIMATDTFKINALGVGVVENPLLLAPELIDLLDVLTEDAEIYSNGERVKFVTDDCVVYGAVVQGIEDFSVDAISNLVSKEYPSKCKVAKTALLQLIDRLSLFVGEFDDGVALISFNKDNLCITSKKSDGVETLPYIEANVTEETTGAISLEQLKAQARVQTSDAVEICFGDPKSIKVIDGGNKVTSIIALIG